MSEKLTPEQRHLLHALSVDTPAHLFGPRLITVRALKRKGLAFQLEIGPNTGRWTSTAKGAALNAELGEPR